MRGEEGGPVWSPSEGLPFLEGHHCRALVFQDILVGVHADVQLVTQLARLYNGPGMTYGLSVCMASKALDGCCSARTGRRGAAILRVRTVMEEVEAPVYPDSTVTQFRRRLAGRSRDAHRACPASSIWRELVGAGPTER